VERFIHFYDNNFWVERKQRPVSLDELNEAALEWIDEISVRTIGGLNESRNERFAHEKAFLTTLPKHSFDCRTPMPARVSTEALVRVKSNWYSVPPEYIGATLTVKIDPLANIAQVLDGQQVVTSFAVIVDEKEPAVVPEGAPHGAHAAVENAVPYPKTKEAGQDTCRCFHPISG
jgi:hypothetical protein